MPDVSVVLPCRNEEKTIGKCITQIKSLFKENNIKGEIIVSDSSTDSSRKIIKKHKIKLIEHDEEGYGIACIKGIEKAKGKYILIGDADGTYDFNEIPLFLDKLEEDYDLVIGSRVRGDIKKGAMPFLHRYLGNPLLSFILNLFFHTRVSDTHSGFRAIKKTQIEKINLKTRGMEFASEMIIKAAKNNLKIGEVPITYYPRIGKSKLRSFSDGWRHLRFMLMFSPTYLFFIPGILLSIIGITFLILMQFGTFLMNGNDVGIHISLLSSLFTILGIQIISLGLYSRIYATHTGFEKHDKLIDFLAKKFPLERGLLIGSIIILLVFIGFFNMKNTIPSLLLLATLFIIGFHILFSVFFLSMMLVEKVSND